MAEKIKGLNIVFGAETKGLKSGLAEINKSTRILQGELREIEKTLKFDPSNIDILRQKQKLLIDTISETKVKLDVLNASKKKADDEMEQGVLINQKQYRQLQREISSTESYLKNLEKQSSLVWRSSKNDLEKMVSINSNLKDRLVEVNKALKFDTKNVDLLKDKQNLLSKSSENLTKIVVVQSQELKELESIFDKVTKGQTENSAESEKLKEAISSLRRELKSNRTELNQTKTESESLNTELVNLGTTSKKAENSFNSLSVMSGTVLANALMSLAKGLKNIGATFVRTTTDFEKGLSEVKAISNATTDEMEKLTEKSKELGSTTNFTSLQVTSAFKYMAMAGWEVDDMLNSVTGVLDLATASGEDLALTSDIVTDAMTGFGLTSKETSKFVDVLATVSSSSNTNVALLGETFKYISPVAGALNYTIKDTALAIGLMANAGIKGTQAGTGLRSIMSRLAAPTKEVTDTMEYLGVSILNKDKTVKSFNEVLIDLRNSMSSLDVVERTAIASTIASKEAMSGFLAIVNASDEDFYKLEKAIDNSNGSARKMAKTMNDNLTGRFLVLKSTVEGIALSFGEILMPICQLIIDIFQDLANGVLNLDDTQKKLLLTIPLLISGIGLLDISVKKLSGTNSLLVLGIRGIIKPIGIASSAVTTLTLIFGENNAIVKTVSGSVSGLLAGFVAFKAVSFIQTLFKGMATAISIQTTATNLATISTTLFNAALTANPIGLVTASAVALGTGIFALFKAFNKATEGAKKYKKETDALSSSLSTINESIKKNTETFEENSKSVKAQTEVNKKLSSEIKTLSNIENLSVGQKLLLRQKIDELNNSVEGLSLSYNEESGILNKNSSEITKAIELQERQVQLNFGLSEQARIREDLALATISNEDAMARLADITLQLNSNEQISYADRKLLLEQQQELNASINQTNETINDLNFSYDEMGVSVELNAKIIEDTNQSKRLSEKEYQDTLSKTGVIAELTSQLEEESKEKAEKLIESFTVTATNSFRTITKEAELSIEELIGNISENTKTVEKWTTDLRTLMDRGVNSAFIETLENAGPGMAKTVENLVNSSDEKIKELNAVLSRGTETAVDGMKRIMGLEDTKNMGSEMADDIAKGIENNKSVNTKSQNMIRSAKETIIGQIANSKFSTAGLDICRGIAQGVEDGKGLVMNAVTSIANGAKSAFESTLDIHSPSRVFVSLSKFINKGIAKGLKDTANLPIIEMNKIGNDLIKEGQRFFYEVPDINSINKISRNGKFNDSNMPYPTGSSSQSQNITITQNFDNVREEKTAFEIKRQTKKTMRELGLST